MIDLKIDDLMYGQPLDENYQGEFDVIADSSIINTTDRLKGDELDAIEIDYNNAIDDRITPEMMLRTTSGSSPLKSTSSTDLNNLVPFLLIGFGIYLLLKD